MALAHKLAEIDRTTDGSAARNLPQSQPDRATRTEVRAAARRKQARALFIVGGISWAFVMGFSLLLVTTNNQVIGETRKMTDLRAKISEMEAQNRNLENKIVQATSVEAITNWAVSHNMVRSAAIKPVTGDTSVVADRSDEQPAPAAEPQKAGGIWSAIKSYVSRMTGTSSAK